MTENVFRKKIVKRNIIIMRMRKKKNFDSRMEKCRELILNAADGNVPDFAALAHGRRVYLEIGCGKGGFIYQTAQKNPDIFFVAIEKEPNVLLMAMENDIKNGELENLRFISFDARELKELFGRGTVGRIYLNFSDPWPPKKQAKRRLTHHDFLDIYNYILDDDGEIHFKTDNQRLFEFSLNEFAQSPFFDMKNISLDLHASGVENIMTEYEKKFSDEGMNIYRLEAYKKK